MSLLFRKACKIIRERLRQPIRSPCNLQGQLLEVEVGCQGFSQNRLKSSITLCFFHSTWRLHNRKTHGRTLQLYHYIVLHLAWRCIPVQHRTLHCSTLHSTTLRCTTLQLLCCVMSCCGASCLYACYILIHCMDCITLQCMTVLSSLPYINLQHSHACLPANVLHYKRGDKPKNRQTASQPNRKADRQAWRQMDIQR